MQPISGAAESRFKTALKRLFRHELEASDTAPVDDVRIGASQQAPARDAEYASLGARPLVAAPIDSQETLRLQAHPLPRPVVMVHGLGQQADTWFNLKTFLCTAPENRFGGVYRADDEQGFVDQVQSAPGSNLFAIDMSDSLADPRRQADELASMITLVKRLTGSDRVDLVTHSMGGLVAREYLHRSSHDVSRLVMIAPPNHGSAVADLGLFASRTGIHDHYPEDRQGALEALRTQRGPLGGERNAYLAELERAWPADSQGVQTTIIAGAGFPTPVMRLGPVASGDGLLTPESAHLDGAELYVARPFDAAPGEPGYRDFEHVFYTHWQLLSDSHVLEKVDEALTEGGQDARMAPAQPTLFDAV